ncbi:MAG: hypothetical protein AAGF72_05580 [Pseudomonadota bacterium]
MKKFAVIIALITMFSVALAQERSVEVIQPTHQWTFTGLPMYGELVTPNDAEDLPNPGYVRANEAGNVTAACHGNGAGNQISVVLAAGEFFPCLVARVYGTGTSAITMHVFY